MSEQQQAELDAFLRQAPVDFSLPVEALRAGFEEAMSHVPVADNIRTNPVTLGGVGAVDVVVDGDTPADIILYFHGGGYVIGSAQSSLPLAAEFAQRTGARVISVDYRLAPEHPFPAAVDDARVAYEELLSQGVAPGRIAFAGESAGGGLAVAAALALRDAAVTLPTSILAMSPWADLTLSGDTFLEKFIQLSFRLPVSSNETQARRFIDSLITDAAFQPTTGSTTPPKETPPEAAAAAAASALSAAALTSAAAASTWPWLRFRIGSGIWAAA